MLPTRRRDVASATHERFYLDETGSVSHSVLKPASAVIVEEYKEAPVPAHVAASDTRKEPQALPLTALSSTFESASLSNPFSRGGF